jgi:hypothetical protein
VASVGHLWKESSISGVMIAMREVEHLGSGYRKEDGGQSKLIT